MKKLIFALLILFLTTSPALARWINGYYRKDGTYVRGHFRSEADNIKWNNYGPRQADCYNPYLRDYDKDGIPNVYDLDDDNDGIFDDYDSVQYN